ncbi:MAG TPA: DUF389 domain-containing protein [Acidimicrobiia bacterium]|nr:DUF389 domain-containing protein [Acidimicrobiia bacterium]
MRDKGEPSAERRSRNVMPKRIAFAAPPVAPPEAVATAPYASVVPPDASSLDTETTIPPLPPYPVPQRPPFDPLRPAQSVVHHLGQRYTEKPTLEPSDRRAIIAGLFFEGSRRGPFVKRYATLTALSVLIAVLGLMADSTAVVIGAMLVAPLMAPVQAIAAALVMGWPKRVRANLQLLVLGALGALAMSAIVGVFARGELDPIPSEVLARTAPNLLDLGIAAAAGAAGAYGYVRKQASDALAGAAVAVALVPPLAVTGLMMQLGEFRLAGGAGLLFMVNVAGALASGAATFLVAGFVPGQRLLSAGSKIQDGLRWAAIATIIVALPLQFGHQTLLPVPLDPVDVEAAIENWANDNEETVETVDVSVEYEDGAATVDLVIATPDDTPPIEELIGVVAEEASEPVAVDIQIIETDRSMVDAEVVEDISESEAAENSGEDD